VKLVANFGSWLKETELLTVLDSNVSQPCDLHGFNLMDLWELAEEVCVDADVKTVPALHAELLRLQAVLPHLPEY